MTNQDDTTTAGAADEPDRKADDAEAWDTLPPVEVDAADALVVDIEGFAGPLDLLLALARTHKLDISRISILALVEQYLDFITRAQRLNLEIAADYLVMAAWLAFLKSRLLLPRERTDAGELSGEELAARLAFRLQRLQAMRDAAARLMTRKRLGIDVFQRGAPEAVRTVRDVTWTADIVDLLQAYARQRIRAIKPVHVVKKRTVWSIKDARTRLEALVGRTGGEWAQLDMFLEQYMPQDRGEQDAADEIGRTVIASSFGATLEMAREGLVELRQDAPYAPIYIRRKAAGADWQRIG